MFSGVCTIFNYYEYEDGSAVWYPHVLSGVHIETDMGAIVNKTGAEGSDKVEVFVDYTEKEGSRYVLDKEGKSLPYLRPKEWKTNGSYADSITFNPESDIFMFGEWDGAGVVNDAEYSDRHAEGFFAYMNRVMDDVYKITKVQIYNVIPHFEVMGA